MEVVWHLDVPDKGPTIRFLGKDGTDGKPRVFVSLLDEYPAVVFTNAKGEKSVAIAVADDGAEIVGVRTRWQGNQSDW